MVTKNIAQWEIHNIVRYAKLIVTGQTIVDRINLIKVLYSRRIEVTYSQESLKLNHEKQNGRT